MTLSSGSRLGPYEILAPIGAGGMGEVYKARDSRLGREVAIKVLPAELSVDSERLRRFEKEARSASSLNHPNIVTVYEIGQADSVSYIAMELVGGKTLRELLLAGPLPIKRLLQIAAQAADGLAKAHEAGIVHRDLKPENVMVTGDGRVKILDFGLAKVTQPDADSGGSESLTVTRGTEPGIVMGTVGYMSPEQASGHPVDYRSDQFSFGSVLYEMATGKRAFEGKTKPEILAAIIRDEPQPIGSLNPRTPAPLRWIVERCLAKEPRERYASTEDLARDLATMRDHLSGASLSGEAFAIAPIPSRRRLLRYVAAAAALLVLSAGVFTLGRRTAEKPIPSFERLTFRRGLGGSARFAPDGQTIVYGAAWEGGPMRLYSTRAGSPESRLFDLPPADILSISSSGEMAVLLNPNLSPRRRVGTLARVPIAGGAPRELLENVQGADWSPDGKELAVIRQIGERRRLEYPIGESLYEAEMISSPRVSPKGDLVAFYESRAGVQHLCTIDRSGKRQTLASNLSGFNLAWSSSGDEIWYGEGGVSAVSLSGRKRTLAHFTETGASLQDIARDGRALVVLFEWRMGIVALPPGETRERELSWFGYSRLDAISRDGSQLLFFDGTETISGVYLRKTDGSSPPVRLAENAGGMDLSPDLKWALIHRDGRESELELVPTGAGPSKVLKLGGIDSVGGCFFPDGKRILIEGRQPGRPYRCFVQDIDGGPARPVTPEGVHSQVLSPDARFLAVLDPDRKILLYPLEGGAPKTAPGSPEPGDLDSWSDDGRSIYVTEKEQQKTVKFFRRDLATGRRELWREITPADPAGIFFVNPILAPDRKSYVYGYSRALSTLYLVQGLR